MFLQFAAAIFIGVGFKITTVTNSAAQIRYSIKNETGIHTVIHLVNQTRLCYMYITIFRMLKEVAFPGYEAARNRYFMFIQDNRIMDFSLNEN